MTSSPDITWLHLSDLHCGSPSAPYDSSQVIDTLLDDLRGLQVARRIRPDVIFFTGDLAFGEFSGGRPLALQFARGLQVLDAVRHAFEPALPREAVLVVPGNHDVSRSLVSEAEALYLDQPDRRIEDIERMLESNTALWKSFARRLSPYAEALIAGGYAHCVGDRERLTNAWSVRVRNTTLGVYGLNSAWSCCRDGERGRLWAGVGWQLGTLRNRTGDAQIRIGLMHHPLAWLSEREALHAFPLIEGDLDFFLHGHDHQGWVRVQNDNITIAAAACYDRSIGENGYNIVQLSAATSESFVWLRQYDRLGRGWVPRLISGRTDRDGRWRIPWSARLRGIHRRPAMRWKLCLGESASRLVPEAGEVIAQELREISNDSTLAVVSIGEGIICIESSPDAFRHVWDLFREGKLSECFLHPVTTVTPLHGCKLECLGRVPRPRADVFVGRGPAVREIDDAWHGRGTRIVQIIGEGGLGKSTVLWNWLQQFKVAGFPGCASILDWSFYSQGHQGMAANSRAFIEFAATKYGVVIPIAVESSRKELLLAKELAEELLRKGGVIALDGVEPLQYAPQINAGRLRDVALAMFLRTVREFQGDSSTMVVLTSRWRVFPPSLDQRGVLTIDLKSLDPESGMALLKGFRLAGSSGRGIDVAAGEIGLPIEDSELLGVATDLRGHPLALVMFAAMLVRHYHGNLVEARAELLGVKEDATGSAVALRVLEIFDRLMRRETDPGPARILRLLGLFDRPASMQLLMAVVSGAPLDSLTATGDSNNIRLYLDELAASGLASLDEHDDGLFVDAHPIVREYYASRLREVHSKESVREAHRRVSLSLANSTPHHPESIQEVEPLLQAIGHRCRAGDFHTALQHILLQRVMRGDEWHAVRRLGALASVASALSHFFAPDDWGRPNVESSCADEALNEEDLLVLFDWSGTILMDSLGYAAPDVARSLVQGLDYCRWSGDRSRLATFVYRSWRYRLARTQLWAAVDLSTEIDEVAVRMGPRAQLIASRTRSSVHFLRGEYEEAIVSGLACEKLYEAAVGDGQISVDPGEVLVAAMAYVALAKCLQGDISGGRVAMSRMESVARSMSDQHNLALGLCFSAMLAYIVGDQARTEEVAREAQDLSSARGYLFQLAPAVGMRGAAIIAGNDPSRLSSGKALVVDAFRSWEASGARLYQPFWLSVIADAEMKEGSQQLRAAAGTLGRALECCEDSGEVWWKPMLYILEGRLRRLSGEPLAAPRESWRRAVELANRQGANLLKAMALVELAESYVQADPVRAQECAAEAQAGLRGCEVLEIGTRLRKLVSADTI